MKQAFGRSRPAVLWVILVIAAAAPVLAGELDERFAVPADTWTLTPRGGQARSLAFPSAGEEPGLQFLSQGLDLLTYPVDVGIGGFEVAAEVNLTSGSAETWRNNGIVIAFSSAPVDQMGKNDWAVVFAAVQQGMIATITRGGARYATEARPGVWQFQGAGVAPRFVLAMGGAGGHDYSARWPSTNLAGTRLRFHAMRTADHTIKLTVHHADGDAGPWWYGEATVPAELQNVPLKLVAVQTGREAAAFARPDQAVPPTATLVGVVRRIAARPLAAGEAPRLNESFPAAVLPAKPLPPDHRPMLVPGGDLAALRRKFNDPAFASYRVVLLRNASERRAPKTYNNPAQGEYLTALLWAFALTQDKTFLDRCITEIDALITVNDKSQAGISGSPGHLQQILSVSEFMGHNITDLATAYDLLGSQLDARRRDRIRFVLTRAVKHYLDRIAAKDWWYFNNPSNTIGVGSGSMGLVALALRVDDPELSKKAVDAAVQTIQTRYTGVRPDGSCIEGNMYWNYGMSYPVMLGFALRNVTGDDRGLLTSPALKNGHRYVENILGGDGTMIPFNDTQPWLNGWLLCAHVGSEFDQYLMRWMADKMAAEFAANDATFSEQDRARFAISAFLYRDTVPAPAAFPGVPTRSQMEGVQEGVLRSDGAFTPSMVVGVKGKGQLSTHHANADQGSFVLYARGRFFLIDPGYFDGEATDHSLPLIGTTPGVKLDGKAACPITDAWEAGQTRSMSVDATAAYVSTGGERPAKRVRRVLVLLADTALVTLDDVEPTDPAAKITAQYQTGFATMAKGRSLTVTAPGESLALTTFGPELSLEATPRVFKNDTWAFAKRPNVAWHSVRGIYSADPARPLVSVMVPSRDRKPGPMPAVTFAAGRVEVAVGPHAITFTREGGLWKAVAP